MRYKIIISNGVTGGYTAALYSKKWHSFNWRFERRSFDQMPYSRYVVEWQREFNIPDKRVYMYLSKNDSK